MAGVLLLGPVVFQGFEVPEHIQFGGRQRLVVHALPGGGRVIDALGAEEGPIAWTGVFSGPGAAVRVRTLERLRRDGAALPLAWSGWRYTVVIETFQAVAVNPAWIPYRLRLLVVSASEQVVPGLVGDLLDFAGALLGGGDPAEVDAGIGAASAALAGEDIVASFAGAASLAQLVSQRAFSRAARNIS